MTQSSVWLVVLLAAMCYFTVNTKLVNHKNKPEDAVRDILRRIHKTPKPKFKHESVDTGPSPQVQTTSGLLVGSQNSYANSFYGIPYAVPPVGNLRFQPPQMLNTPEAIRAVNNESYVHCVQPVVNWTEDCLILNVFVPKHVNLSDPVKPPSDRLPVMFWIHGGAFFLGSGTVALYEGRYLSQATNTVVVLINYRLGLFGFLVYGEGEDAIEGNQGIKDQQLAMQWVQNNIENFGGDKNRVTIFGESAGGQSVMFHLLSEISNPLFHRGIMQSNPAVFTYPTRQEAHRFTNQIVASLRCNGAPNPVVKCCADRKDNLTCLLEAEPRRLLVSMLAIQGSEGRNGNILNAIEPFRPYIDGVEFEKQPLSLFKEGKWNSNKPIIIGTNAEELNVIEYVIPPLSKAQFKEANQMFNGLGKYDNTGDMISEYYIQAHNSNISDYGHVFGIEMTDIFFNCPSRALARFASATKGASVYLYVFSHALDGEDCKDQLGFLCGHSYHTHELFFVFRTIEHVGMLPDNEDEMVCDQFSTYWGGFARAGNPSTGIIFSLQSDHVEWVPYTSTSWANLRFDEPNAYMEHEYTKETCDFWDSTELYMKATDAVQTTTDVEVTTSGSPFAEAPMFEMFLFNSIILVYLG